MARKRRIDLLMDGGLFCSCCSSPPDPPDYSASAEVSAETAARAQELAEEQFAWSKQESARNREILNQYLEVSMPMMEKQAERYGWESDMARTEAERAQRLSDRWERLYKPLEKQLLREAQEFDTPERRAREAAEAMQGVAGAYEAERENAQQRLESYGIDPSMTRSQALDVSVDIAKANEMARAARGARTRTEDMGRALRHQAYDMGRGYASNVAGTYGTAMQLGQAPAQGALSAGSSGVGSALGTSQTAGQLQGTAPGYLGAAQQGAYNTARIQNLGYGNQLAGWEAGQAASPWGAVGSLVGMGAKGYFGGTWTPFGADGGEMITAAELMDGGMPADPHAVQPAIHFFDGGVVTNGYPTTAGVRVASYADGGVTGGAIHGQAPTSANLRPLSYADGGLPPRGALTGSGGPGMGGVTGPQRTTAGLRRLADGGGQTHAMGGDSSYQGSRANVRYPLGNSGGLITGLNDGTGIDDAIPAQVSAGEYVIPADVVHIKGREFFDKLLDKYHTPAAEQEAADTPPPNLGVPAVPMAADGGALPQQVPAHARYTQSALPPASGGAGYFDGGAIYLTGGRGGNPDKRVHRPA